MMAKWKPMPTNTKHALEMEAKTYKYPPHITMIQEIIANAQDAFNKHETPQPVVEINLKKIGNDNYILFHNNAMPIPKKFFEERYHTLYESSKNVGENIGFVGIGAKIFLPSHKDAEIITLTGKREILASKWKWTKDGAQYLNSLEDDISEIVDLNKFHHTNGTTFICNLSDSQYSELQSKLKDIVYLWWNYALLSDLFVIKLNNEKLKPMIPNKGNKFYQQIAFQGHIIKFIFWITENELDEDYQNIIYTVHGKRIENVRLDTDLVVKDNFGKKIFCYVDVTFMAKYVLKSKEGFEKHRYVSQIQTKIRTKFWDFVKAQGLYKDRTKSITKNVELENLAEKLNDALQSKKFKELNPFLAYRKRKTIVPDKTGKESVSITEGTQTAGTDNPSTSDHGGSTTGNDSGKANVLDPKGPKSGDLKDRRTRGISISEIEHGETEKKEAYVSEKDNAIIINTGHPFYKKIEGRTIAEFHKYRIIIEALVRYRSNAENWNTDVAFDKTRETVTFHI